MRKIELKSEKRKERKMRIRAKISGTAERPRLSVFRSNMHIYGQLVDDAAGKTLVACSDISLKEKGKNIEVSGKVGEEMAKKAIAKKIKKVVFDRGGFRYHGRVKAFAEGARKGGLEF